MRDVRFVQETRLTVRKSRRRTTVPKRIMEELKLGDKDSIRWFLLKDGTVIVGRARG